MFLCQQYIVRRIMVISSCCIMLTCYLTYVLMSTVYSQGNYIRLTYLLKRNMAPLENKPLTYIYCHIMLIYYPTYVLISTVYIVKGIMIETFTSNFILLYYVYILSNLCLRCIVAFYTLYLALQFVTIV